MSPAKQTKQLEIEFDTVPPDASSQFESMRAQGYTLASAIADLIDNSISAKSKNVWIELEWEGFDSWISITDDGTGMTERELVSAMKVGSRSPLDERAETDLGRFGLGLKTASCSQARRFTVITRPTAEETFLRRWDLDWLAANPEHGWALLRSAHENTGDRASGLDQQGLKSGTQVLLEGLDRLVGTSPEYSDEDLEHHRDNFLREIDEVREHLEMVFHRFLSRHGRNGLKIHINGAEIEPWDPFLEAHSATQNKGTHKKSFGDHQKPVEVCGFVLPHKDKFKPGEHPKAGGPEGWNAHQGFYVYRGERLIIAGDWLGLGWKQEEHYKLARIRLDIPNSMDREWTITSTKSSASPPPPLRRWLKNLAADTRGSAVEVYRHRGAYGPKKKRAKRQKRPWISKSTQRGYTYKIDRKHPVLAPLIKALPKPSRDTLEVLLLLIEETVPVRQMWIDYKEHENDVAPPFGDRSSDDLRETIMILFDTMTSGNSSDPEVAWKHIGDCEAFQSRNAQAIIATLREESSHG